MSQSPSSVSHHTVIIINIVSSVFAAILFSFLMLGMIFFVAASPDNVFSIHWVVVTAPVWSMAIVWGYTLKLLNKNKVDQAFKVACLPIVIFIVGLLFL